MLDHDFRGQVFRPFLLPRSGRALLAEVDDLVAHRAGDLFSRRHHINVQ